MQDSGAPVVSVVIPTQSRCQRLSLALRTALDQDDVDHEVVVVDDGSRDETPRFLARQHDSRLRVVRHDELKGVAAARNAGLAAARGEWVAFLDDDDLWAPDKLAAQLAALHADPAARWCATGSVTVDGDFTITGGKRTPRPSTAARLLRAQNVIPGGGSGVLAARSLLVEVGGFDPRLSLVADRDLWIRLAQRAPLACVDRPLVGYVLHGANLSSAGRGYEAELLALEAKYRLQGIRVSTHIPRASLALRDGRRGPALRLLLTGAVKDLEPRSLARVVVIASGSRLEATVRRTLATALPWWWLAEAERWLERLRTASLPPEEAVS